MDEIQDTYIRVVNAERIMTFVTTLLDWRAELVGGDRMYSHKEAGMWR